MTGSERHADYIINEILEPLEPPIAIKFPKQGGSQLRGTRTRPVKTVGGVMLFLANLVETPMTADGKGRLETTWDLSFDVAADQYRNFLQYVDKILFRIQTVRQPEYTLLGDYSAYPDPDQKYKITLGATPEPESREMVMVQLVVT